MEKEKKDKNQLTIHFFRHNYGRMVAVLVRYFGLDQVEVAEDIVQDTLVEALEKWSTHSIPNNPEGWLMDVAKKKTINLLRREALFANKVTPQFITEIENRESDVSDSTLEMIFACCHPALPAESQIVLALKTLCGLSISEVADSLLTTEENINKRLYRAKKKFREGSVKLEAVASRVEERLDAVLQVLYLLFNQGYFSIRSAKKIRLDMCYEAIRLLSQVELRFSCSAKVLALQALMHLSISRFESRISPLGDLLVLEDQDRSLWDHELISIGMGYLTKSIRTGTVNRYQLEAGILAEYCLAESFESTNWQSICSQYEVLEKIVPQPNVAFNKAIVLYYMGQKDESLQILNSLESNSVFSRQPLFYLTQGLLLRKSDLSEKAVSAFEFALKLATAEERALIDKRIGKDAVLDADLH